MLLAWLPGRYGHFCGLPKVSSQVVSSFFYLLDAEIEPLVLVRSVSFEHGIAAFLIFIILHRTFVYDVN